MVPYIALLLLCLTLVQFYYNWKVQRVTIFLSLALAVIAVMSLTHYFFCYGTSRFWLAVFFNHFTPLYFLLGPLLFFYVRGTLSDRPGLQKSDVWHFVPFLASLAVVLPYLSASWEFKLGIADALMRDYRNIPRIPQLVRYPPIFNFILRNLSAIGYTLFCLYLVLRFERDYPDKTRIPRWHARSALRFMKGLLYVCLFAELVFTVLYGMYFADSSLTSIQLASNPMMHLLMVGLSAIPMVIVFNPEVLYGIPRLARAASNFSSDAVPAPHPQQPDVDAPSLQMTGPSAETHGRFLEMADRITRVMEERKPYLDPGFSIESLASLMEVPRHHLYYCFNSVLQTRFTRLRAEYRVRHVQRLIREGQTETKTLDAIGIESGFASSASFRAVFKEVTGMSPREYQHSLG